MLLSESLYTPPWSMVYFSTPLIVWALCFAYCHFTYQPKEGVPDLSAPTPWYEHVAANKFMTFVGGGIMMALLREVLVLFG